MFFILDTQKDANIKYLNNEIFIQMWWWLVLVFFLKVMVDPLKIFWVLTNSTYLGKYFLIIKLMIIKK